MERSAGIIGVLAIAVIMMAGAFAAQGVAVQAPAPGKASARVASRAQAVAVIHAHGGRAFSAEAQRRAILDQEWDKEMQARCAIASPFAAPASRAPVC